MKLFKYNSNQQLIELLTVLVFFTVAISNGLISRVYTGVFEEYVFTNKDTESLRTALVFSNFFIFILACTAYSFWSFRSLRFIDISFILSRLYLSLLIVLPFVFPIQSVVFQRSNILFTLNVITFYSAVLIFCAYRSGILEAITNKINERVAPNKYLSWSVLVAMGFYILYFGFLSVLRHIDFGSGAYDLGIYSHVFHSLSIGDGSWQTVNYNGDFGVNTQYAFKMTHFSPFYYLLVPFYMLYPKAESLLVIQAIFMGAAAIPLYRLAVLKTDNKIIGLVLVLSYLLNPAIEKANMFDFHDLKFMPFFLFYAFYYLEKNNIWKYLIFMAVVVTIKEDLAVVGFLGGLYYCYRNGNWKFSIGSSLCFLFYYFIVTRYVMVMTVDGKLFIDLHTESKTGLGGVFYTIVSNPLYFTKFISLNMVKVNYWYQQLQIVGFLPLLSPDSLIVMASTASVSLFSNNDLFSSIGTQYALYPVPFLYYSTVLTIHRYFKSNYIYLVAYVLLFLAGIHNFFNGNIIKPDSVRELYSHKKERDLVNKMLLNIPKDATVSAVHSLVPHLTERKVVFMFPRIEGADYIVYQDKLNTLWPDGVQQCMAKFNELLARKEYGVYKYYDNGLFILKKGYINDSLTKFYVPDVLNPLDSLISGQYMKSSNGIYKLILQNDGNLVLYKNESQVLWSTNTLRNSANCKLQMQGDGNLVLTDKTSNTVFWASNTGLHHGSRIVLQTDGNIVIYNSGGEPVWSSNTSCMK